MSTILAFDFGTSHIGVASGSAFTKTASPRAALKARDGIPDEQGLNKLMQEWQPAKCVVGLPLNADGSEQEMTKKARRFGNRLAQKFKVKVEFVDERYTSVAAKERIFSQGGFRALASDKGRIDSESACEILEQYFAEYDDQ